MNIVGGLVGHEGFVCEFSGCRKQIGYNYRADTSDYDSDLQLDFETNGLWFHLAFSSWNDVTSSWGQNIIKDSPANAGASHLFQLSNWECPS